MQRQLASRLGAEVAYVGSRGFNMPMFLEVNPGVFTPGQTARGARVLPVAELLLHEQHDPLRSGPLMQRLQADGVLKNPTIVAPICIMSSFIVLAPLGFSLNLLTLLALVLSIGLVVDDAIVVVENIQRRVEEGEPAPVAGAGTTHRRSHERAAGYARAREQFGSAGCYRILCKESQAAQSNRDQ